MNENRSIETELITDWDTLEDLRDDWNRLWKQSDTCMEEFYEFDWMCAVARHQVPPPSHPWCIVARKDGRIVGIAPLFRHTTHITRLQIPVRSVTFFPNEFIYRHNFLTENVDEIMLDALVCHIFGDGRIDIAVLTGLKEADARRLFGYAKKRGVKCSLLQVNSARGGVPGTASVDLCAIDLRGTWEQYVQSRKKKWCENLRRRRRLLSLEGRVGFWRCAAGNQITGDSLSIPEIIALIRRIETNAWQTSKGLDLGRHADDYLCRLLGIASDASALDVSFLLLNGCPIAYNFGLIVGRLSRSCRIAFDSRFRRFSPGVLLRAFVIQSSFEHTCLERIDLGGSRHVDKYAITGIRDSGYEFTLYTDRPRSRVLRFLRRLRSRWHVFHDRDVDARGGPAIVSS